MNKRVHLIDSLRGFSLLGILIANMLIFQYGIFGKDEIAYFHLRPWDEFMYVWIKIFVESSFMPIFLFLFGYSAIMLKNKLEKYGKRVKWHLFRRFLLLIIFGLLHAVFLWEGDILFSYGFTGIVMLIFVNRKRNTILYWAIGIFLITSLTNLIPEEEITNKETENISSYIQKANDIYATGTYHEIFEFRNSGEDPYELSDYFYPVLIMLTPFIVCPMLLFGMYAAKSGWFTNPGPNRMQYREMALIFVIGGLLLKSVQYVYTGPIFGNITYAVGGPILAMGYIFTFSYFYSGSGQKYLSFFEGIGRLSMTNYLFQTIICTSIFYGYGLGLFGELGVLNGFFLAIIIYSCQAIISYYYLKRWKMGPFEKLMRIGTYLSWSGKMQSTVNKDILLLETKKLLEK